MKNYQEHKAENGAYHKQYCAEHPDKDKAYKQAYCERKRQAYLAKRREEFLKRINGADTLREYLEGK